MKKKAGASWASSAVRARVRLTLTMTTATRAVRPKPRAKTRLTPGEPGRWMLATPMRQLAQGRRGALPASQRMARASPLNRSQAPTVPPTNQPASFVSPANWKTMAASTAKAAAVGRIAARGIRPVSAAMYPRKIPEGLTITARKSGGMEKARVVIRPKSAA